MPYVHKDVKDHVNESLWNLIRDLQTCLNDEREGAVVYAITEIVVHVLKPETGWRWRMLKNARACFMEAFDEFGRRLMGPYEDVAITRNGDVPAYRP